MHIPDVDHVVRHVNRKRLRTDDRGQVLGILPQALELREGEDFLSVNWLEYFDGNHATQLRETKKAIASDRTLGPTSALSIGNIASIKSVCKSHGTKVRIAYAPQKQNPAHSAIYHLHRDDLELLDMLTSDVFTEVVQIRDIN